MSRGRVLRIGGAAALVVAALAGVAFSLRALGPAASWNVFAAPTATPTATATSTFTATPTATSTPTPTATATPTPLPTATPIPIVRPAPPPIPGPEVTGERWVDVDIDRQTATAMIGERALYTALVTTGKDSWETPRGTFKILFRVPDETMTSESIGADDYYVLDHVLYTQYFTSQGHALHLNYWRDESYFGRTRSSHGCVGMRMADAEFFWNFATFGTRVTIH